MDEAVMPRELIERENAVRLDALLDDYESLGRSLDRRGVSIEAVKTALKGFAVAIPSWGVGVGGTRFAKFPIPGEPTNIFEKLEDCAVVQALGRNTPTVSTHFPWDRVDDVEALKEKAAALGVGFDAVNSNTFQDQPGQPLSYKFGSLTHADAAVRDQAVQHNIDCIEIGEALGAETLTVWIADGSNFAGQSDLTGALDRYLDSMARIYAALPKHWRLFIEHKLFEPAFYSTVVSDWGTSLLCAQTLGEKAQCLVDLGHHAPNVNIEQIVARLARFGKLGGFHFNDSKYGDDDLDAGSINPHQLFLVFNELVEAERRDPEGFRPAYMLDQSHNVTDPIESLLNSAGAVAAAHARALVVDREALAEHQKANDVIMGFNTLRRAYDTDVTPILAMARYELGGAIDPIAAYRSSEWRVRKAQVRKPIAVGQAGIV
jgi:L-rhamnose isomerase / sugar isomerase